MKEISKILLLTACVNPDGMMYTALQRPEEREFQYLQALRWYLDNTDFRIVLCENSNYQLPEEFNSFIGTGRLEYLTIDGNGSVDKERGKGLGEFLIIKHALQNSVLLKDADQIIKITGRLVFENIRELAGEINDGKTVYCNMVRNKVSGVVRKSHIFAFPRYFLETYFTRFSDRINDSMSYYFENALFDACAQWIKDGFFAKEFKKPLLISGISGSTGKRYANGLFPYSLAFVKYYMHKLPFYK